MADSVEKEKASRPRPTLGRAWSGAVTVFKLVAAQWLVIGFGLSCVFAYFFPSE